MKFFRALIVLVLVPFFHINSANAECNFGLMLGDDVSKAEAKYGSADEISENLSSITATIEDICPGNNLGNSTVEMQFLINQLVSFSIIVTNGQYNAESKKMLLYKYVEQNYGKINSSKKPSDWTGFKVWRKGEKTIVYKKMYDLGSILEEELFITNKESKELLANNETAEGLEG